MTDIAVTIPPCTEVNCADARSIAGYAHLLISAYRHAGGFDYPAAPARVIAPIVGMATRWLALVRRVIPSLDICHVAETLSLYDLVYRIVHHTPAPTSFIDRWNRLIFDARFHNRRPIADATVFLIIDRMIKTEPQNVTTPMMQWYTVTENQWLDDLTDGNGNPCDRYNNGSVLLRPGRAFQSEITDDRLSEITRRYLDHLSAIDPAYPDRQIDGPTLQSFYAFLHVLRPLHATRAAFADKTVIDQPTYDRLNSLLLTALSRSATLDPHHRHAYLLDLQYLSRQLNLNSNPNPLPPAA